jgi:hypothetical protein
LSSYFNLFQVILGFYSPCLKEKLEMFSFCSQKGVTSNEHVNYV